MKLHAKGNYSAAAELKESEYSPAPVGRVMSSHKQPPFDYCTCVLGKVDPMSSGIHDITTVMTTVMTSASMHAVPAQPCLAGRCNATRQTVLLLPNKADVTTRVKNSRAEHINQRHAPPTCPETKVPSRK